MRRLLISAVLAIILALVGVRVLYAVFTRCCAPPPIDASQVNR